MMNDIWKYPVYIFHSRDLVELVEWEIEDFKPYCNISVEGHRLRMFNQEVVYALGVI